MTTIIYQKFDISATQTSLVPLESISAVHVLPAAQQKASGALALAVTSQKALILVETVTTHIPSRLCDSTCDV